MPHSNLSHRRTHNLLLISKLLSQRDNASPFTLVQDTLEQPARPLITEYVRRATLSKCHTIYLSFETLLPPKGVDTFVKCFDKTLEDILKVISATTTNSVGANKRYLVLIDSMSYLASLSVQDGSRLNLTQYLSSIVMPPPQLSDISVSLVAVYHTDVPIVTMGAPYAPTPLSTLSYLATTVITTHSLSTMVAEKAARDRSLPAPVFGLAQEVEGIVIGLKPAAGIIARGRGIVLELEHRRKSGRGVLEWFFLPSPSESNKATTQTFRETVILLDDHPLFKNDAEKQASNAEPIDIPFSLGLTERQRQDREEVILPYMDAQKSDAPNEGGRILYDMGVEDDFDDEEDEI